MKYPQTMKLLKESIRIAKQAGEILIQESEKGITVNEKSKNNLVTNADHAAENFIIEEIKKLYPKHGIIAEESSNGQEEMEKKLRKSDYIWIIDPLDGTTNFSRDLPLFAVSIGIFKKKETQSSKNFEYIAGELVTGVVYAPRLNELFYAEKGKGAFLNDKKIQVSDVKKIETSLTVTGFPPTHKERNLPYFNSMVHKSRAVRRLGAASLDLCYIAAGRFDGFWEFGLKPWDIAAGSLIITEAGGTISDTNGNTPDLFGEDILATNGKIHHEMVDTFQKI
jgi:myo-inositol-1(or 4)-monophosphatase